MPIAREIIAIDNCISLFVFSCSSSSDGAFHCDDNQTTTTATTTTNLLWTATVKSQRALVHCALQKMTHQGKMCLNVSYICGCLFRMTKSGIFSAESQISTWLSRAFICISRSFGVRNVLNTVNILKLHSVDSIDLSNGFAHR